jgi:hypothetical protein
MFGKSNAALRRRRLLAWAALWLFALRALVPIGFMVSLEASHAAVTMCPDYAPLPPAAAALHAHHQGLHHAAHGGGTAGTGSTADLPGVESHGLCPFAAAALTGWHGAKAALAAPAPDSQRLFNGAAADAAVPRLEVLAAHPARGPPALNPA